MRVLKKILILLLVISMSFISISGCSTIQGIPIVTITEAMIPDCGGGEPDLPNCDAGFLATIIGIDERTEMNHPSEEYTDQLSSSPEMEPLSYVTAVEIEKEEYLTQTLDADITCDGQLWANPKSFTLSFMGSPLGTETNTVILESSDPGALYFPYDDNAEWIPETVVEPQDNALPAIPINIAENGYFEVSLVGSFDGEFPLTVRDVYGDEISSFSVSLIPTFIGEKEDEIEAVEAEPSKHEHCFVDQVVPSTAQCQGYTQHSCSVCGYSYRDNYTERAECPHEYMATIIPPSFTSGGYTLHTCSICGESYYDEHKEPLVCDHSSTKDTVIAPTCTEAGYTLHECLICRNYAVKDEFSDPLGHAWDGGTIAAEPSCGRDGTIICTCSRCGDTRIDPIASTGEHMFLDTIIEPTVHSGGFTEHTCTVCSYTFVDTETPPIIPEKDDELDAAFVRTEVHNFCKDCGLDFHGWSQTQVWEHCAAHVEQDDNAKGGYYSSVVRY